MRRPRPIQSARGAARQQNHQNRDQKRREDQGGKQGQQCRQDHGQGKGHGRLQKLQVIKWNCSKIRLIARGDTVAGKIPASYIQHATG